MSYVYSVIIHSLKPVQSQLMSALQAFSCFEHYSVGILQIENNEITEVRNDYAANYDDYVDEPKPNPRWFFT